MYQDAGVVVEKLLNKDENQCPAGAKPGLHFNSLILENLLRVQQKGKCHVSIQIGPTVGFAVS